MSASSSTWPISTSTAGSDPSFYHDDQKERPLITPSPTPSPRLHAAHIAKYKPNGSTTSRTRGPNTNRDGTSRIEDRPNGHASESSVQQSQASHVEQSRQDQHVRRRSSEAKTLKLSPEQISNLMGAPESLPLRSIDEPLCLDDEHEDHWYDTAETSRPVDSRVPSSDDRRPSWTKMPSLAGTPAAQQRSMSSETSKGAAKDTSQTSTSSSKAAKQRPSLPPLNINDVDGTRRPDHSSGMRKLSATQQGLPSPMPAMMPLPPRSLPTYLHLELSVDKPSALYIQPSMASEFPYESAAIKFERLRNFLILPFHLEHILVFGAIACLDAWLYTFTILPLRFFKALAILLRWMVRNVVQESIDLAHFTYSGVGRLWHRRRQLFQASHPVPSTSTSRRTSASDDTQTRQASLNGGGEEHAQIDGLELPAKVSRGRRTSTNNTFRHRRTRSTPSVLSAPHKADLLQGLLIVTSCIVLMWFDASRMYHSIRGQAAIKLYVIYNVLEVFDRLLSALGQDILECLFSKETLERGADGRSKVLRPFWMFLLALAYVISHSTALFYQVVTLNVAVNSYSNALLTLLMSNQFVEIKSAVFKKFEKENLFQMTCADVVERFTLWLMLLIIALRNVVEVGGLTISLGSTLGNEASATPGQSGVNGTSIPFVAGFAIPKAFTLMPKWTGELLGPFLIVLGSEALVDWCKHAYITKFNNVRPIIYDRFLDTLAKDYYSHAFSDQNLIKRLGLPVIPLSCLFIRAVVQTYHMFLATNVPVTIPSAATAVSLNSDSQATSSATMAALHQFDQVLRRALGRSSFGAGTDPSSSFAWWSLDDVIALATMAIFFMVAYLVLLALKLALGMALLTYARNRYRDMKVREQQSVDTQGRRLGGWGTVEVSEDKRRWIYSDDPEGLAALREKESKNRQKADKVDMNLDNVDRYSMVAKRIW